MIARVNRAGKTVKIKRHIFRVPVNQGGIRTPTPLPGFRLKFILLNIFLRFCYGALELHF